MASLHIQKLAQIANLAAAEAPEEDKIAAMMKQSIHVQDFSVNTYRSTSPKMTKLPPASYICYRCLASGHYTQACPGQNAFSSNKLKRSTGIPCSFMTPVSGPEVRGAYLTNHGYFAVPTKDMAAYLRGKKEKPPFVKNEDEEGEVQMKKDIPPELMCPLCKEVLTYAAVIPCCGNSFCDECIRDSLLESDDHRCPLCKKQDVSPDSITANRFLRTAVTRFLNNSGYTEMKKHQPAVPPKTESSPPALPPTKTQTQQLVPVQPSSCLTIKADQSVVSATRYPATVQVQETSSSPTDMNPALAPIATNIAAFSRHSHNCGQTTAQQTPREVQQPTIVNPNVPQSTSSLLNAMTSDPTGVVSPCGIGLTFDASPIPGYLPLTTVSPRANMIQIPLSPQSRPLPLNFVGSDRPMLSCLSYNNVEDPRLGTEGSLNGGLSPFNNGKPNSPHVSPGNSKLLSRGEVHWAIEENKHEVGVNSSRTVNPTDVTQCQLDHNSQEEKQRQFKHRSQPRSHTPHNHSHGSSSPRRYGSTTPHAMVPERELLHRSRSSPDYSRSPNSCQTSRSSFSLSPARDSHCRSQSPTTRTRLSYSRSPCLNRSRRSMSPISYHRSSRSLSDHHGYYNDKHSSHFRHRSRSPVSTCCSPKKHSRLGSRKISTEQWIRWARDYLRQSTLNYTRDQ